MSGGQGMYLHTIGTKRLETKRTILRRIQPEDAKEMYYSWAKYESVCRYFPFHPVENVKEYHEKVKFWNSNYESDIYFHWVVELKDTHELIATINLGGVEESCDLAHICYMLSPKYWGRGLMTEILKEVLRFGFMDANFHRLEAEVFEGNTASDRVLVKCGMKLEGTARGKYYKDGTFIDARQYAMLKSDYERM